MTEQKKISKDWKCNKLGEIFTIERGGSPRPIEEFITNDLNGINWIKIGDTKNVTKYITKTKEKIKPEGIKRSRMVYKNDFILSNSMSFGKPYIMQTEGCIHDGWLVIRKNEKINNDYLYYILSSPNLYKQFTLLAKGSTVKNLNIEAVKNAEINYPPLPTQLSIVSKIEELFSELDAGIANLKIAQQQLKTYRQSVLKWAFEGKLTNEIINEGELPKGWEFIELGKMAKLINGDRGKNYPNRNEYVENGIPFINTGHIEANGTLSLLDMNYISREKFDILNGGKIIKGDLVYCLRGATMGKIALVDQFNEGAIASSLVIIRSLDKTYNKFLYHFLISPLGREYIKKYDNGSAQPNLSANSLAKYLIPTSDLETQKKIVQEIESRLSVADKMEESINQSLQQAEGLRQSILKKAFEGGLI